MIVYAMILYDDTIVGGAQTMANMQSVVCSICALSPCVNVARSIIVPMPFSQIARERMTIVEAVQTHFARVARFRGESYNVGLFLCLNGHSKLWKGREAVSAVRELGQQPALLARDEQDVRFSSIMYQGCVALTPSMLKAILEAIPPNVVRTLLFIDTCHSMSLFSSLNCPARNIRIINSSGEEEKTWQTQQGSVQSQAWARVLLRLVGDKQVIEEKEKGARKACLLDFLAKVMYTAQVAVAQELSIQTLSTGPGQAMTFYSFNSCLSQS